MHDGGSTAARRTTTTRGITIPPDVAAAAFSPAAARGLLDVFTNSPQPLTLSSSAALTLTQAWFATHDSAVHTCGAMAPRVGLWSNTPTTTASVKVSPGVPPTVAASSTLTTMPFGGPSPKPSTYALTLSADGKRMLLVVVTAESQSAPAPALPPPPPQVVAFAVSKSAPWGTTSFDDAERRSVAWGLLRGSVAPPSVFLLYRDASTPPMLVCPVGVQPYAFDQGAQSVTFHVSPLFAAVPPLLCSAGALQDNVTGVLKLRRDPGTGVETAYVDFGDDSGVAQGLFGDGGKLLQWSLARVNGRVLSQFSASSIQEKLRDAFSWLIDTSKPVTMAFTIAALTCAVILVAVIGGVTGASRSTSKTAA